MLNRKNNIYYKKFDKMPNLSRKSIKNDPFKHLPEDQIHQEFTPDSLPSLDANYEAWEAEKQSSEKKGSEFFQLLIMDDITAQLKNKDIEQDLKN
jgi:hypothetical protein